MDGGVRICWPERGQGKGVPVDVYRGKASGELFAGVEDIAAFVAAGMEAPFYAGHEALSPKYIRKLYTRKPEDPEMYGSLEGIG